MSKVELSAIIEKRIVYVHLYDISLWTASCMNYFLLNFILDIVQIGTVFDISSSVTKLSRLDNPAAVSLFIELVKFSEKLEIFFIFKSSCHVEGSWKVALGLM